MIFMAGRAKRPSKRERCPPTHFIGPTIGPSSSTSVSYYVFLLRIWNPPHSLPSPLQQATALRQLPPPSISQHPLAPTPAWRSQMLIFMHTWSWRTIGIFQGSWGSNGKIPTLPLQDQDLNIDYSLPLPTIAFLANVGLKSWASIRQFLQDHHPFRRPSTYTWYSWSWCLPVLGSHEKLFPTGSFERQDTGVWPPTTTSFFTMTSFMGLIIIIDVHTSHEHENEGVKFAIFNLAGTDVDVGVIVLAGKPNLGPSMANQGAISNLDMCVYTSFGPNRGNRGQVYHANGDGAVLSINNSLNSAPPSSK